MGTLLCTGNGTGVLCLEDPPTQALPVVWCSLSHGRDADRLALVWEKMDAA